MGGRGASSGKGKGMATKSIRTGALNDDEIKKLEAAGGRRWQNYGKDRIYFNAEHLGLEVDRYNSGNISSAKFMGEKISNTNARNLASWSFYIDAKTGERHHATNNGSKWEDYSKAFNENFDKIVDDARREK